MSAICPLKVQKPAKKRNNQFFVSCRKTALLCDFCNISKLCKMRGGIFDSRTGHQQHLLTFGLTKPIVSFLFCSEKAVVRCLSANKIFYRRVHFLCTLLFFFQKAESSVHCLCYSRLCGLELMAIYIQSR